MQHVARSSFWEPFRRYPVRCWFAFLWPAIFYGWVTYMSIATEIQSNGMPPRLSTEDVLGVFAFGIAVVAVLVLPYYFAALYRWTPARLGGIKLGTVNRLVVAVLFLLAILTIITLPLIPSYLLIDRVTWKLYRGPKTRPLASPEYVPKTDTRPR